MISEHHFLHVLAALSATRTTFFRLSRRPNNFGGYRECVWFDRKSVTLNLSVFSKMSTYLLKALLFKFKFNVSSRKDIRRLKKKHTDLSYILKVSQFWEKVDWTSNSNYNVLPRILTRIVCLDQLVSPVLTHHQSRHYRITGMSAPQIPEITLVKHRDIF